MINKLQIDAEKCTGCRTCEVICSLAHTKGLIKPRNARVFVYRDEVEGVFAPVISGPKTSIEYIHKIRSVSGDQQEDINKLFTLLSQPSRRCNLCGICTEWCVTGALKAKEA
ncbi:hypothetical protein ACFLU4_06080 [Chloroflexota bacterium]